MAKGEDGGNEPATHDKSKKRNHQGGVLSVGTFIFTFFIGTLKEIWASGNWDNLISFKVFFSVGLFIFSLFIPKIIKKIRKEA